MSVKRYEIDIANFVLVFLQFCVCFRRGEIVNKVVCSPVLLCLFSLAANFQNGCYILIPCLKLELEKLKEFKQLHVEFSQCLWVLSKPTVPDFLKVIFVVGIQMVTKSQSLWTLDFGRIIWKVFKLCFCALVSKLKWDGWVNTTTLFHSTGLMLGPK